MPESRKTMGRLSMNVKKIVKGGAGGTGPVHFFFPPLSGEMEFGVQGKPIAEIRAFPVSRRFESRLRLPAVSGRTGAVESAVFTDADILSAYLAAQRTAYGAGGCDRSPAIPTHKTILPPNSPID
jgi:hypothetical protein